jgi:maltokinase
MASGLLGPDAIEDLTRWITSRRWFARKNDPVESIEILSSTHIPLTERTIEHLVARVRGAEYVDDYQLLITSGDREYVDAHVLPDSVIKVGERVLYEIFGDWQTLAQLQELFEQETQCQSLQFHSTGNFSIAGSARVVSSEQSNSSVIFGDQSIAKFYRRITPGVNPDLEIGLVLTGSNQTAEVLGWLSTQTDEQETTLAVVHRFLSTAVDGFEHALSSVRDLIASDLDKPEEAGADFAAEAHRLGEAVARVHVDLATGFGTAVMTTADARLMVSAMNAKLDEALSVVPLLAPFESSLREIYGALQSQAIELQRIHGDLHLGQVLRDTGGWIVLDFEGEPGSPLEDRRRLAPAIRDVAGMLRSFDYAARQPLINYPNAELHLPRTAAWAERNRGAFLDGYLEVRPVDLQAVGPLMRALEAEKAVYETVYEHRFRPDWIGVPLGGIKRLVEGQ